MNQSNIFKKIGLILNELQDQYEFLSENPEQLSELELELFLANANFLTDHVQIVKKLNYTETIKQLPAPDPSFKQETQEPKQEIRSTPEIQYKQEIQPAQAVQPDWEITHQEIPPIEVQEETLPVKQESKPAPFMDDLFELDNSAPSFEFIINETPVTDKFDFEEKSVGEIFDRPLSAEEQQIIAQKQRLKDQQAAANSKAQEITDDEIGPEPFLVSTPETVTRPEPVITSVEPVLIKPEPVVNKAEPAFHKPEPIINAPEPVINSTEPITPNPVVWQAPVAKTDFVEDKIEEKEVQKATTELTVDKVEEQVVPAYTPRPTLNDLLAGNKSPNVNDDSTKAPVTDLKKAVNLNEKLLYIKDLFNGYNLAYSEAIDLINKMPDFATADTFLRNNYAGKNNWEARQDTVDKFYELLHQRFPKV